MRNVALFVAAACLALPGVAAAETPEISGSYVEARTCDVYTGPCFANGEMGLAGKEAILAWVVKEGAWDGIELDGLSVMAAVRADGTLDDLRRGVEQTESVVIVDARADEAQRIALVDMARAMAGGLVGEVVEVRSAPIEANVGSCSKNGCAEVKAEGLAEIATRCLGGDDHVCGNEETYYPPLTDVEHATPAFTKVAKFEGDALGLKWQDVGSRSAFLGTFAK